MESQTNPKLKILMFGLLGSGKSTVANALLQHYVFKCADTAQSVTKKIMKGECDQFIVYDVPGMSDPEITTKHWIKIASEISNQKVDLVLFCVNSTNRVSNNELIYSIAMKHILMFLDTRKLAICFTRCGTSQFTRQKAQQYISHLWKCLKWDGQYEKTQKLYLFEKENLDINDLRLFVYNSAICGSPIQVKNLISNMSSIKKTFYQEVVSISEEAGEMADDLFSQIKTKVGCFQRRSVVRRKNKDGTIGYCKLQDLKLDDQVMSYDPIARSCFYDKVVYVHDHSKDYGQDSPKYVVFQRLVIQDKQKQISKTIQITGNHYVFVKRHASHKYQQICAQETQIGDQFILCYNTVGRIQMIEGLLVSKSSEVCKAKEAIIFWTKSKLAVVDETVQSCVTDGSYHFFAQKVFPFLVEYFPAFTKKCLVEGSESIRYNADSRVRKLFRLLGYSGI